MEQGLPAVLGHKLRHDYRDDLVWLALGVDEVDVLQQRLDKKSIG